MEPLNGHVSRSFVLFSPCLSFSSENPPIFFLLSLYILCLFAIRQSNWRKILKKCKKNPWQLFNCQGNSYTEYCSTSSAANVTIIATTTTPAITLATICFLLLLIIFPSFPYSTDYFVNFDRSDLLKHPEIAMN